MTHQSKSLTSNFRTTATTRPWTSRSSRTPSQSGPSWFPSPRTSSGRESSTKNTTLTIEYQQTPTRRLPSTFRGFKTKRLFVDSIFDEKAIHSNFRIFWNFDFKFLIFFQPKINLDWFFWRRARFLQTSKMICFSFMRFTILPGRPSTSIDTFMWFVDGGVVKHGWFLSCRLWV